MNHLDALCISTLRIAFRGSNSGHWDLGKANLILLLLVYNLEYPKKSYSSIICFSVFSSILRSLFSLYHIHFLFLLSVKMVVSLGSLVGAAFLPLVLAASNSSNSSTSSSSEGILSSGNGK